MKAMRITALLLALLLTLPLVLFGCSKNDGKKDAGKQQIISEEEVDESEVYDAKIRDLGGHEFWFITRTTGVAHLEPNEIYAKELTGDKINDAVFKRNATLEETYNCVIKEERNESPSSAVREMLLAGEYMYDYIYDSVYRLRPLSAQNLLADFNTLEEIDLSKAWWDQNAIDGLTISGKAFYVTGDAGTMDDRGSQVIYMNRDIIARAYLDDPYELVREGKWTVEKMVEYMEATKEDIDGDGVYTIGKDRFGYIGEWQNNYFHMAGFNIHIVETSSSGDVKIPGAVSKEMLAAWQALKPLLASPYRDISDSGSRFRAGLGTFFGCNLGVLFGGKLSEIDFGILPLPKLNEEQEYYWTAPHFSITFGYAIPVTTDAASDAETNGFDSGREQAAYFLDAFAYQSRHTLSVAFYDQVMNHQMAKDEETVEMLKLVLEHKHYDIVGLFDFGGLGRGLFGTVGSNAATDVKGVTGTDANYDNLVSTYESRVQAARKALNKYINYIDADDNSALNQN
ncbi:MAG: hypothetical protein J6Z79_05745 [Clostridia bacterium]|nr:hypothetical protein [Clostridia bacterium]